MKKYYVFHTYEDFEGHLFKIGTVRGGKPVECEDSCEGAVFIGSREVLHFGSLEGAVFFARAILKDNFIDACKNNIIRSEDSLSKKDKALLEKILENAIISEQESKPHKVVMVCYLTRSNGQTPTDFSQVQTAFVSPANQNIRIDDQTDDVDSELHLPTIDVDVLLTKSEAIKYAKIYCPKVYDWTESGWVLI